METAHALDGNAGPHPLESLPMSRRVREAIGARLVRLSDPARRIVAVAAVLGRAVDFPVMRHAAGLDEATTAGAIEEVVRRRVVRSAGDEFDFVHDHVRNVALEGLPPTRRRLVHGAVAAAIEAVRAPDLEPYYAILAGHFEAAADRDGMLRYLRKAGEAALARGRPRGAAALLERAIEALGREPRDPVSSGHAVDLRIAQRAALHQLGELDRAVAVLTEAVTLARGLDDPRRLAWVRVHLTGTLWVLDRALEALAMAREALEIGEASGDRALAAAAGTMLGGLLTWLGDHRGAHRALRSALPLVDGDLGRERFGLAGYPAVMSRVYLVSALGDLGEFEAAVAVGQDGIRAAEALEHPYSLMQICLALGLALAIRGDLVAAVPLLERSLTLCRERDMSLWSVLATAYLGHVHAMAGRLDEGIDLLRQTLEATADGQLKVPRWRTLRYLAEAHLAAGRLDDARTFADEALERARAYGERGVEAWALRALGDIAERGAPLDTRAAEGWYGQALALAQELGMRPLAAHCDLGLGELHGRSGRSREARGRLTAAAAAFRAMGMTRWVARAEEELQALPGASAPLMSAARTARTEPAG